MPANTRVILIALMLAIAMLIAAIAESRAAVTPRPRPSRLPCPVRQSNSSPLVTRALVSKISWHRTGNLRARPRPALSEEKAAELAARFADWAWDDLARAADPALTYDEKFNSLILRSYDIAQFSGQVHL